MSCSHIPSVTCSNCSGREFWRNCCGHKDAEIAQLRKVAGLSYDETVQSLRTQLSEAKALIGRLVEASREVLRLENPTELDGDNLENRMEAQNVLFEVLSSAQTFLKPDPEDKP